MIAGAGSGKTKTLAHRVAHLVVNGVDPQRILLLTFSRRAAARHDRPRETHHRGSDCGTATMSDLPWAGTFHAVGARFLREYAPRIGLEPSFTILDRADAADLIDLCGTSSALEDASRGSRRRTPAWPSTRFAINSETRSIETCCRRHFPGASNGRRTCASCSAAYVAAKQRQNVLDYDDLLLCWCGMMNDRRSPPSSATASITCWSTNTRTPTGCRPTILLKLKPDGRGLTVVGDDAQSIYSFRAATVRNILDFPEQFDAAGAHHHA